MASSATPATGPSGEFRHPGNRLGLPKDGPGSVATWGRRVLALVIDWLIAGLIASALTGRPMWAGGNNYSLMHTTAFFAMSAILAGLVGSTIGHRLCGLRVAPVRDSTTYPGPPGLLAGIVRSLLICLVIPAVVYDRERRGLHDLAAKTVVVRR
ncbi:putative RDD family membrane protein YckC [Kribbella aluminosa]|uniref:RDD family membrane protein YckC n=1 Tax=Kribbella aluminosa TaxID=416017 RepID=A0ABS4UZ50_9ACTN|nr:RDD family protein [Kribbella aluminosa]MBP2356814.1 putative RDD family membrane protein YckC [Kribbella aluminosa]